jgi:hypothetical protein
MCCDPGFGYRSHSPEANSTQRGIKHLPWAAKQAEDGDRCTSGTLGRPLARWPGARASAIRPATASTANSQTPRRTMLTRTTPFGAGHHIE